MAARHAVGHAKQPAAHGSARHARRNRVLTIVAWLMLIGLVALVVDSFPAQAAASTSCTEHQPDPFEEPPQHEGRFEARSPGAPLRIVFDESRLRRTDYLKFDAFSGDSENPRQLHATLNAPLRRADGRSIEDGDWLTVAGFVERSAVGDIAALVRVCVAIDPARIPDLRPGRYDGEVALRALRYREQTIDLVVSLRGSRDDAITLAVAGVLIGLVIKILTELAAGQRSGNPGALHGLRRYVLQWSFPLTIILGVLAGWLAFNQMYEGNRTWGVEDADSLRLFGMCFGFQLGSIGGADMAKRLVG
jgi:hypothetical protein